MSFNSRVIPAPIEVVWDAVVDPTSYPEWLIGAEEIRDVDDRWPEPGSSFHHRVGLWRFSIPDRSDVLEIEPGSCLRLAVKARPFLSAVATFRLYPVRDEPATTIVTLEEEPAVRWLGNLVRPVLDPSIHVRNQRSLRRLEGYLFVRLSSVVRP
jgi:uncharacterized protein YndB with AHSA1/START domain